MAGFDIEEVLDAIETFLTANLNTKIGEINTRKGNEPVLKTVDNDAYIFQTLNNKIANYNPFVFYGIEQIETANSPNYGATSKRVKIDVIVVVADPGEDNLIGKRMLRYGQVLTELFESNFNKVDKRVKFEVQSLEPISFKTANTGDDFRAVGVQLAYDFA